MFSASKNLKDIILLMRKDILEMTTVAGTGHPTSSLSAVELMTVLFHNNFFKADFGDFLDKNNDRLIFSKGHASPLFYALYKSLGIISKEELLTFRQFASVLEGHPTPRFPFTEATTGSLGQGLGIGLGMAISSQIDKIDNKIWVLLGDSELAEGSVWEAVELAAQRQMNNLTAIVDLNRLGQRGETMHGWNVDYLKNKFFAYNWLVIVVEDGNNIEQVEAGFNQISPSEKKPTVIIAKTQKGAGVPMLEDQEGWHGKTLSRDQFDKVIETLN
jgi:transketolase